MAETEETVEIYGSEVPARLAEFYRDSLSGLISVRSPSEGVLVYSSAGRVGGRPALEIPHEDPVLVDESDVPGGTTPPKTFEEHVRDYGLSAETVEGFTYVYVPRRTA